MGGRRKCIAALALAVGLTLGTSGIADAVTVGVRGISSGGTFVWSPTTRTVHHGTVVRWTAASGSHTVKSWGGNWRFSRTLPRGTSTSRVFHQFGKFRFFCTFHGRIRNGRCFGMCGRIIVR